MRGDGWLLYMDTKEKEQKIQKKDKRTIEEKKK